jgi:hypothetical protein
MDRQWIKKLVLALVLAISIGTGAQAASTSMSYCEVNCFGCTAGIWCSGSCSAWENEAGGQCLLFGDGCYDYFCSCWEPAYCLPFNPY